jgi:ubiquinone/menaquinone biosynthesis C-methylase UbiE
MAFMDRLTARATEDYADFLMPDLSKETHLLDLGCGDGALTVGLAAVCGRVTALDRSADEFREGAGTLGIANLTFVQGDAMDLPFADAVFDAILAHSVLESGVEPSLLLGEARRVLRAGGRLGVASVEYGGLILAGPQIDLLRRSNGIRERVWLHSGSNPFLGRELRRLVIEAGFVDVEATSKTFDYGTPARVRTFADGRASECSDPVYVAAVVEAGLTTEDEMAEMAAAWYSWGESHASYAAFTWCRVLARTPLSHREPPQGSQLTSAPSL